VPAAVIWLNAFFSSVRIDASLNSQTRRFSSIRNLASPIDLSVIFLRYGSLSDSVAAWRSSALIVRGVTRPKGQNAVRNDLANHERRLIDTQVPRRFSWSFMALV
jgi:hypothetical protein